MSRFRALSSFAGTFLGLFALPVAGQEVELPVLDDNGTQAVCFDFSYSQLAGVSRGNSPACDDPQYSRNFLDDPKAFFGDDQVFDNWRSPAQSDPEVDSFLAAVERINVGSNEDLFKSLRAAADSSFSDGYIVWLTPFGLTFRELVRFEEADKTGTTKTGTVSIEWPPKPDSDPADNDF